MASAREGTPLVTNTASAVLKTPAQPSPAGPRQRRGSIATNIRHRQSLFDRQGVIGAPMNAEDVWTRSVLRATEIELDEESSNLRGSRPPSLAAAKTATVYSTEEVVLVDVDDLPYTARKNRELGITGKPFWNVLGGFLLDSMAGFCCLPGVRMHEWAFLGLEIDMPDNKAAITNYHATFSVTASIILGGCVRASFARNAGTVYADSALTQVGIAAGDSPAWYSGIFHLLMIATMFSLLASILSSTFTRLIMLQLNSVDETIYWKHRRGSNVVTTSFGMFVLGVRFFSIMIIWDYLAKATIPWVIAAGIIICSIGLANLADAAASITALYEAKEATANGFHAVTSNEEPKPPPPSATDQKEASVSDETAMFGGSDRQSVSLGRAKPTVKDLPTQLEELLSMKLRGGLTEEEFSSSKKAIIASFENDAPSSSPIRLNKISAPRPQPITE